VTVRGRRLVAVVAALLALLVAAPVAFRAGSGCRAPATGWRGDIVARLACRPRGDWGAAEPRREPSALVPPTRVTIHHSGGAVFTRTDATAVGASIRAIQRDHQERRGWADIGYHYIIDPAGGLWEGRDSRHTGAHAGSADLNAGNLGVLVLGNFDLQEPSSAQLATLDGLLELLCAGAGICREAVHGHNEVRTAAGLGPTQCPGRHLAARLDRLRK